MEFSNEEMDELVAHFEGQELDVLMHWIVPNEETLKEILMQRIMDHLNSISEYYEGKEELVELNDEEMELVQEHIDELIKLNEMLNKRM